MVVAADTGGAGPGDAASRGGRLPAGRHGLPREFIVHNQKARLLDAMGQAVAELGYAGATLNEIIGRAGVSRKTFYEHFADKEDCFLQAYDAVADGLIAQVAAAYAQRAGGGGEPHESWETRVRRGIARLLEVMAAEPHFARMCIVEGITAGTGSLGRLNDVVNRFAVFIEEGRDELPDSMTLAPFVSQAVVSGITGILYRRIIADGAEGLPELLPDLTYFALAPYVGRERAAAEADIARERGGD